MTCLGVFTQEWQVLWFLKDDLQDSSWWSSPPLVLLRGIHNGFLAKYDSKDSAPSRLIWSQIDLVPQINLVRDLVLDTTHGMEYLRRRTPTLSLFHRSTRFMTLSMCGERTLPTWTLSPSRRGQHHVTRGASCTCADLRVFLLDTTAPSMPTSPFWPVIFVSFSFPPLHFLSLPPSPRPPLLSTPQVSNKLSFPDESGNLKFVQVHSGDGCQRYYQQKTWKKELEVRLFSSVGWDVRVWGVGVWSWSYRHVIDIKIYTQWCILDEDVTDFRFELGSEHRVTVMKLVLIVCTIHYPWRWIYYRRIRESV